jgi:hypothetical protein
MLSLTGGIIMAAIATFAWIASWWTDRKGPPRAGE